MEETYIIFSVSELDKINFNEVLETAMNTTVKSIDNTKTFVRYEGAAPESLQQLTTIEATLTHSQILDLLQTPEWKPVYPDFNQL